MLFLSVLIVICGNMSVEGSSPPYSTKLETELQDLLFRNYSRLHRPAEQVKVTVSLSLLTINEMNIKDQTLSVSARLTLEWEDDRLSWNGYRQYSNIQSLFSYEELMWRPPVIIENSKYIPSIAEKRVDKLSVLTDKYMPMKITSDGTVSWNPAGIFTVDCDSDITYYPLDYQTCELKITTASYTQSEIRLRVPADNSVSLEDFSRNGEWHLQAAVQNNIEIKQRKGRDFSSIPFMFTLRRRYLFHALNTLFPVILMALLIPMVFKLQVDSGEKIGYSLTVLLAYAVYLTPISEYVSSTSVSVCYLSVYLAFTLAVSMASVVCSILVINVYHTHEEHPMPRYLKNFGLNFLARISCWNGYCCCYSPKKKIKDREEQNDMSKWTRSDYFRHFEPTEPEFTWTMLCFVLDNFFFYVFMLLVTISTVTLITVISVKYDSYN